MKWMIVLGLCVAVSSSFAQKQWRTEVIRDGYDFILKPGELHNGVNSAGAFVYTAWGNGSSIHAWRGLTSLDQLYLGPNAKGQMAHINERGQAAYTALDSVSLRVMVEGTDYYTMVCPPSTDSLISNVLAGVDEKGLPFWMRMGSSVGCRVFHGAEELSAGQGITSAHLVAMNGGGDCWWTGSHLVGGRNTWDLFRGSTNYSEHVLGEQRGAASQVFCNERRDVLWVGSDSAHNQQDQLFVNDVNVTQGWLSGQNSVTAEALSANGHALWVLFDSGGKYRLFKDKEDVSTPVFGNHAYTVWSQIGSNMINAAGDVLWKGWDNVTDHIAMYLNDKDISTPILGTEGTVSAGPNAFLDDGTYIWTGRSPATGGRGHIFINDYDLTADQAGDYYDMRVLAMSPAGHILWATLQEDNRTTLYLTSPVPEPSSLLLALPVAAAALRRHRRR